MLTIADIKKRDQEIWEINTSELLKEVVKPDFDTEVVESLLQNGANPNAYDDNGQTCLHNLLRNVPKSVTASKDRLGCLKLLIDYGANVNATTHDPMLYTPLMLAAKYNSNASLMLLLHHGADVFAKNSQGKRAEDFADAENNECMFYIFMTEFSLRRAFD